MSGQIMDQITNMPRAINIICIMTQANQEIVNINGGWVLLIIIIICLLFLFININRCGTSDIELIQKAELSACRFVLATRCETKWYTKRRNNNGSVWDLRCCMVRYHIWFV